MFSVINDSKMTINEWLVKNPSVEAKKVIIPKELKWEVRDKLDQANITERVLFPGIDGTCTWLKRYYAEVK